MDHDMQPFVHCLASCVRAPSATLSDAKAEMTGDGAEGFFLGDRRLLSRWVLRVFDRPLEAVASTQTGPATLTARAVARDGSEDSPDPRILIVRTRQQHGSGFTDEVDVYNFDITARSVPVALETGCDFAATAEVKAGRSGTRDVPAERWAGGLRFHTGGYRIDVRASGDPTIDAAARTLRWLVVVAPHSSAHITISVDTVRPDSGFRPRAPQVENGPDVVVMSDDERLDNFVRWSVDDLAHLLLADPDAPEDVFAAAGLPWYATLFGRDSLWAARMMLPFGTGLAMSTLRVLARRQGVRVDPSTAEQPGRILHELRPEQPRSSPAELPARYYGSIDATPLWMITLVEAWRWGADPEHVAALLPALESAAGWLLTDADADGDGLCEYHDATGRGLTNQGWKDSGDSINWRTGELADGPIALCEVQGYAYEAALGAADLLERFGRPRAADLRAFAARLYDAFHSAFWLDADDHGTFVAIGLDGAKRAITGVSSNPGHLIATGLLDADQERMVAGRLISDLASVAGLRTLSAASARYNPLSYHNGSIWPHDTAICARGMVLAGLTEQATTLLGGIIRATETFGPRLPELYAVLDDDHVVAYPAACCPQAWVAASAGIVAWAVAPILPGPDVAGGPEQRGGTDITALRPVSLVDHAEVSGLIVGGREYVARTVDGHVTVSRA